jgi:hypothetical protein
MVSIGLIDRFDQPAESDKLTIEIAGLWLSQRFTGSCQPAFARLMVRLLW